MIHPLSFMGRFVLLAGVAIVLFLGMPCMAVEQTFRYEDAEATKVEIAGEFNNWRAALMERDSSGAWTLTLDLPAGTYGYKFLINGETWAFDSVNRARKVVGGQENSAVTVGEGAAAASAAQSDPNQWTFSYSDPAAQAVFVAGSFNGWSTTENPLSRDDAGVWTTTVPLPPGETTYKFVVDGEWKYDPANPKVVEDGAGGSNSAIIIGGASADNDTPATRAPETAPTPAAAAPGKTVQFAGSPVTCGQTNIVEITVTSGPILKVLEKAYGKKSNKAKVLLALPADFDAGKSYPLVIETATTDGNGSSVGGAQPYLDTVLGKEVVLLAVDGEFGKPSGNADSTTFRWTLVEAALQQMQMDWPASKAWPVITAGISGGAGYASFNAIMLVNKRYPVIGMFLANSGWTPVNFTQDLRRAPSSVMHKVPVFMTAGDNDTIATQEITERAHHVMQKERFKNIRYETFVGGHELSPALFSTALDWFVEQSKK